MVAPRGGGGSRPTVAQVNYSFFHSTQSFIYFYLRSLRDYHSICLTRAPESPTIERNVPAELRGNLFIHGGEDGGSAAGRRLARGGIELRRLLATRAPRLAGPALELLNRRLAPRLRRDTDPERFLSWAERILRERDARLIHAYFGPVGWRSLELKRRLGLPLVVMFLGDEVAPTLAPWWDWWIRDGRERPSWPRRLQELFKGADLLLAEGPHLRERLLELGCPPEKAEVQRIAIPVSGLPFRVRRPPGGREPVIVFAGRFCEQKGVLYALEAARILRAEGRAFELRLIGDDTLTDGGYAAKVHAYIRDHDLAPTVRLLGFLNHADYLAELERGDIFIHPSVVDSEGRTEGGAPTTIIEAQALGMPVVATRHCDIPNVTAPGRSALLAPERDAGALADLLRELLDDPSQWEAMGRAGRAFVETNHEIETEAALLGERYRRLLATGESPDGPRRPARAGRA